MKAVKIILLIIAILLIIPLVTALFVPKDYTIEREILINKPKLEVFDYIRFLKNQDNFSVWAKMDPDMKKEYRGTDGEVGFVSAWESQNGEVGKGEQEIKKIKDSERIDFELRFLKPFTTTASAYMATEYIYENQTKVKWGFKGHLPYPFNLMLLFMNMDQIIGDDLETGLTNLKVLIEHETMSQPAEK